MRALVLIILLAAPAVLEAQGTGSTSYGARGGKAYAGARAGETRAEAIARTTAELEQYAFAFSVARAANGNFAMARSESGQPTGREQIQTMLAEVRTLHTFVSKWIAETRAEAMSLWYEPLSRDQRQRVQRALQQMDTNQATVDNLKAGIERAAAQKLAELNGGGQTNNAPTAPQQSNPPPPRRGLFRRNR